MFSKIIDKIEKSNIQIKNYILTFFFAILLRTIIETYSGKYHISFQIWYHYLLFYISIAISFIILFKIISKETFTKISKIVLIGLSIIPFAPLIDLILSKGKGAKIGYLIPGIHDNIQLRLLQIGGQSETFGITTGIKIQIIIIIIFTFIYSIIKTKNTIKSIIHSLFAYLIIIIYMLTPFIITAFSTIKNITNQIVYIQIFSFMIAIQAIILSFLFEKKLTKSLIKDSRPILIAIHFVFLGAGFVVGYFNNSEIIGTKFLFTLIISMLSIFFAAIFSLVTNNIIDIKSDIVNQKRRPDEIKTDKIKYTLWGYFALLASTILALSTGFIRFILIMAVIGNYYIYSVPPLQVKKIPIISKIFIATNYIFMILIGFSFTNDILTIDFKFIAIIFMVFFLTIHFRDIKDLKGDKESKIRTLPVLLGKKKSKFIIGSLFIISYTITSLFFQNLKFKLLLISLGILQFLLCSKKKFSQKPIFITSIIFVILITIPFINFENVNQKITINENTLLNEIKDGINYLDSIYKSLISKIIIPTTKQEIALHKATKYLQNQINTKNIGLKCISTDETICPVDKGGESFAAYFIVSAIKDHLNNKQKGIIIKELNLLEKDNLYKYSSQAVFDSDDTAFAHQALKELEIYKDPKTFEIFFDNNSNTYKTFLWGKTGIIVKNKSVANNSHGHLEVNANIFALLKQKNMPNNLENEIDNMISQKQINSYFYPSKMYAPHMILRWLCTEKIYPEKSNKIINIIFSSQEQDGSWNENPYDTALALVALKKCNIRSDNIKKSVEYLLNEQNENGSWGYNKPIWTFRYQDNPIVNWNAYDSNNIITTSLVIEAIKN